ncbi:Gfo/Idh/MocA family protein [Paenibacillus sp. DMB20]|uniref:Gfo/Idh/MocA family protein n=1 Tax=Paenibacillus sp. DMB20 TaxID=1642570 RepID=UPI0006279171|nr:Gfo/Idh/MocA family oxidoreductase [Paenibacillus sp. DMB20]KKO53988.1 oxidoreductase [Paenibacillus sp. DMB20]
MLNIGIIGYGVRIDMLMDDLFALPYEVRIKAVADTNHERVRALMKKDGSKETMHHMEIDKIDGFMRSCEMNPDTINFYRDADEMLDKEKLDGVIVGTNCNTHTYFAKKVLNRNLPLFLEKPVATSMEDLRTLAECEAKATAPTVVSFPLRVTPLVQEVKRILDCGMIGKVEHVQAFNDVTYGFVYFHDWYRDESVSKGLFLQKATHDIDVINYLLGEEPLKVCAMKSKQIYKGDMPAGLRCSECDKWETCMDSTYNIMNLRNDTPRSDYCGFAVDTGNEDSGSMIVKYESGMHAMYSQNFFARKGAGRRGARLYGYKGTVEFDFVTNEIKVFDHMSDKVTTVHLEDKGSRHGGGDIVLMRNFVHLMQGKTTESVAPLKDGIRSALVCLQAKASSESDQFYPVTL